MRILYQNDAIAVAEKDPGMPCQPDPSGDLDLLTALSAACGCRMYPVHRLDRPVGGVVLAAKTAAAAARCSEAFVRGDAKKEYLAVLEGACPLPCGTLRDYLFYDSRSGKSYPVETERRGAKEAVLDYRCIATEESPHGPRTLVAVRLHTGRTHQIRVQFASRGSPLCGDGKYGGRDNGCAVALWAVSLQMPSFSVRAEVPPQYPWTLFSDAARASSWDEEPRNSVR